MTTPNDGGPAFPQARPDVPPEFRGMTLRDYYAGVVLGALLANPNTGDQSASAWAKIAHNMADAMLAERAKRQERGE
jgi:hypothetical protein